MKKSEKHMEDEDWHAENEERHVVKNNKDPPIEGMNQIPCEYNRTGQNEEEYVRRPMNAFMVWSRSERRKLALKYPNMLNCEISKLLGAEWSKMSEVDKKPYILESKKLRTIHNQKYPEYSYRPRRKKRKNENGNSIGNSLGNTTSMHQNGISCYGLQNNDIYDASYNNGNFNSYGYFYDQFANPSYHLQTMDAAQPSTHNLNYSTKFNNISDNKLQNYYPSYQSNCTYPSTYSDSYKLVTPYSINDNLQNTFQCSNYFSNFPYMNNSTNTSEVFDKIAPPYSFGTMNNLFPDITTNSTTTEVPNLEQIANPATTKTYPTTTTTDATKIQTS